MQTNKKPRLEFTNRWHFLNFAGFLGLVLATLIIPLFVFLVWPYQDSFLQGILLARSSIISGNVGNHSTIFLIVLATTWTLVAIQMRRKGGFVNLMLDKFGMFYVVLCGLLIAAVHESEWLVVYIIRYGWTPLIITHVSNGTVYSQWLLSSFVIFLVYVGIFRWGRRETSFALGMVLFYVGWFDIGFPITLDFRGALPSLLDLTTNGIEILSWAYACGLFLLLYIVFRNNEGPAIRLKNRPLRIKGRELYYLGRSFKVLARGIEQGKSSGRFARSENLCPGKT